MVYFASGGSTGAATFSSAGFIASIDFIAAAGFSGIIAHAKPCASHTKKLAKRHAEERPAQKNTSWPLALALANNPTKKKEKVATEKPTAKDNAKRTEQKAKDATPQ